MRNELASMVGMTLVSLVTIYAPVAIAGETHGNALVLGGGGPVGEAWESGVIAGLADKGVYLSRMDRIIGTSAGAVVGARLAMGMTPEQLIQQSLTRFEGAPPAPTQKPPPPPDLSFLVSQLEELNAGRTTEQSVGIEVGKWALNVHPIATESEFVASFWRRFPKKRWPSGAYECVSVNAADGSLRVWNGSSGVPLALAVASSCALPGLFAPVEIDGQPYMDGGARSATNADLARGSKTAIVMVPTAGINHPLATLSVPRLDVEVGMLRKSGCRVALILPDSSSTRAFGQIGAEENRNAAAMDAGRIEGHAKANEIAALLNTSEDSRGIHRRCPNTEP
jgi:NTE family protein